MVEGAYTPWYTIYRPLYVYCLIHGPRVRLVIGALAYLGARREGRSLNDETRNFHDVAEAWMVIRLGVHAVKTPTMSTTINWSSLTLAVSLLVRDTRWICVQIRRSRGYPAHWSCTHLQGFVHEAETVKRSWLKKKRNEANRDNVTSDTLMAFSCTTSRLGNKLKIIPRVND